MIDPRHPDFTALPGSAARPPSPHRAPASLLPPLVQVASVLRGRASTAHDTLRSLQQQTLARWRWVVVDRTDGSARAQDVMARLGADPRVHVIRPASDDVDAMIGVAARGETPFLCFIRPGDLIEPTALETWAWALSVQGVVSAITSSVVTFGAVQAIGRVVSLGVGAGQVGARSPAVLFVARTAYDAISGAEPSWQAEEEIEAIAFMLVARTGAHIAVLPAHHVWRRTIDPEDPVGSRFGRLHQVDLPPNATRPTQLEIEAPFENPLEGDGRAVLFAVPFMLQGGAERATLDQATILASRGWRVTVVALGRADHTWRAAFAAVTPDVHVVYETSVEFGDWEHGAAGTARFLSYLITSRGIDVLVVGGTTLGLGSMPWLRRRHPGLAVSWVRHSTDWPPLSIEFAPLMDMVMVSTDTLVGAHEALGVPRHRLRRIVTGVDTVKWAPDAARRATVRGWLGLPLDAPVLVYASRLSPDKQPMVFADTMAALVHRGLDVHAVVTGYGSEFAALERRLAHLGLTERVRLLGEVRESELPGVIGCADVAFLPSMREGIALSLLEGMACGLPFVGTAASSQGEVVSPEVGALIPRSTAAGEALAYTEALARILGDPTELQEMSRRARARIDEAWSCERMGDQLESGLAEAMVRASSRRADGDVETITRCLAGVSLQAVAVDLLVHLTERVDRLTGVLERLGYDATGRPIVDGASAELPSPGPEPDPDSAPVPTAVPGPSPESPPQPPTLPEPAESLSARLTRWLSK